MFYQLNCKRSSQLFENPEFATVIPHHGQFFVAMTQHDFEPGMSADRLNCSVSQPFGDLTA